MQVQLTDPKCRMEELVIYFRRDTEQHGRRLLK